MNHKISTILIIAVLMFLLGVQVASAEWLPLPETGMSLKATPIPRSPLPTPKLRLSTDVSENDVKPPVGVLYIFSTEKKTKGYDRFNFQRLCQDVDPEAHFCSLQEIEYAWTTTGVFFGPFLTSAWVDNPQRLGAFTPPTPDEPHELYRGWSDRGLNCQNWTTIFSGETGTVIDGKTVRLVTASCTSSLAVTCCKKIP